MPYLHLEHVDLAIAGEGELVHDLDLEVFSGELLVLVGDDTVVDAVLKAVQGAGDVSVERGTVRIGSQVVNALPAERRDIGMIFQPGDLYPHLTVAENLAFPLRLAGVAPEEIRRRVEDTAARLDLTPLLDRTPPSISGGQRQLVLLGCKLVRRPEILVQGGLSGTEVATVRRALARWQPPVEQAAPAVLAVGPSANEMEPDTEVAVLGQDGLLQRRPIEVLRGEPASLAVAAAVADQPLITITGTLRHDELEVGPHVVRLPRLHPTLQQAAPRPVHVVLDAGSILGPEVQGRAHPHRRPVVSGALRRGPTAGIRRLEMGAAAPGEAFVTVDPDRLQLFDALGGEAQLLGPPGGRAPAITLTQPRAPSQAERPPARRGRTYVNLGFAAADDARRIVQPRHLEPRAHVWLWVEIGPRVAGAVEGDVEVLRPELLAGLDEVEVILFPDEGLAVTPDDRPGRLGITPQGPFTVRRPAARPPHAEGLTGHRLFFAVTAPDRPGEYRLRCAVYGKGLLLHVEQLTVVVGPSRRATRVRTTFRLVRDIAAVRLPGIAEHRLSVYANAQPDGSHVFCFRGGDKAKPFRRVLRLGDSAVQTVLDRARGALRKASWGSSAQFTGQPSRYDKGSAAGFAPALAAADLIDLACNGYHLWLAFAGKVPVDDDDRTPDPDAGPEPDPLDALRALMQAPGGAVQLAPLENPDHVLPLQLLYDRPLDVGDRKSLTLCSSGAAWLGSGTEELPCLRGCSEPAAPDRVCPAGFWGLRHQVAITPIPDDICGRGLPPSVPLGSKVRGVAGFTTDERVHDLAGDHEARIAGLLGIERTAYSREAVRAQLDTVPAQVLYFLCHVTDADTFPMLVVGPPGGPGIDYSTLVDLWKSQLCPGSPLVVLNACDSAAPAPERLLNLVGAFLKRGAAGAVGTEITVFVTLAMPFGEHLLRSYVGGVGLGEAIRRARVAMLARGNPLGLGYVAFGVPGLALVPDAQPDERAEGGAA